MLAGAALILRATLVRVAVATMGLICLLVVIGLFRSPT